MLNRPTRVQTYMEVAHTFAKRSTCMRRNVGAIIVRNRTIIGHGYNGSPPGAEHCKGNDCPGKEVCHLTVHAEMNALTRAGSLARGSDMYCTDSPCPKCADALFAAEVERVFFAIAYRLTDHLDALMRRGVHIYQVAPAGYIIDWRTKDVVEVAT